MWPFVKPKTRHIVALLIFWTLLLLAVYLFTISNESYEEAKLFIVQDARVAASIGQVKKIEFKFWHDFEFVESSNSGHANYLFDATTDQGVFTVEVRLRKTSGVWRIEAAEVRAPGGSQTRIVSGMSVSSAHFSGLNRSEFTGGSNLREDGANRINSKRVTI